MQKKITEFEALLAMGKQEKEWEMADKIKAQESAVRLNHELIALRPVDRESVRDIICFAVSMANAKDNIDNATDSIMELIGISK